MPATETSAHVAAALRWTECVIVYLPFVTYLLSTSPELMDGRDPHAHMSANIDTPGELGRRTAPLSVIHDSSFKANRGKWPKEPRKGDPDREPVTALYECAGNDLTNYGIVVHPREASPSAGGVHRAIYRLPTASREHLRGTVPRGCKRLTAFSASRLR